MENQKNASEYVRPPAQQPAEPLFRAEVMAEKQNNWLGTVLLESRLTSDLFGILAVATLAAVMGVILLGSFTSKARINGWLVPEQGLVRIYAPTAGGVVTNIYVQEGTKVNKGAPLLALSGEVQSEAVGATVGEIVQGLRKRRDSYIEARAAQEKLFAQKFQDLSRQIAAMSDQQQRIEEEIANQLAKLQIGAKVVERERIMQASDLISTTRFQHSQQDYLDQLSRFKGLERERATARNAFAEMQGTINQLPMVKQTALAEMDRNITSVQQELAEAQSRLRSVVVAPQDGMVTGITTEAGSRAFATTSLMTLVPADSKLQAQLYAPSRAIGFVHIGQRVSLRFQPFPFQKFGFYGGTISSVSRSAINPAELQQGAIALGTAKESVYRITVNLDKQTASAYGEAVDLRPGMQVEADVLIETRRLIEWILDPVYAMSGGKAA